MRSIHRGCSAVIARHRRVHAERQRERIIGAERQLLQASRRGCGYRFSAQRAPFLTAAGYPAMLLYGDAGDLLDDIVEMRGPESHPDPASTVHALYAPGVHYSPWRFTADGFSGWTLLALDRRSRLVATMRVALPPVVDMDDDGSSAMLELALARRDLEALLESIDDSADLPFDSAAAEYFRDEEHNRRRRA